MMKSIHGYKNEVSLNACHECSRGTTLCFSFLMVLSIALMTPRHDTHSQDKRKERKRKEKERKRGTVSQSFELCVRRCDRRVGIKFRNGLKEFTVQAD